METISDLSSTQEYSDIELNMSAELPRAGSHSLEGLQDEREDMEVDVTLTDDSRVSSTSSTTEGETTVGASNSSMEAPPSPSRSSSPCCSSPSASPSHSSLSAGCSSSNPRSSPGSPQAQIHNHAHIAPPAPVRVTNFFISEILKPDFGGQQKENSPAKSPVTCTESSPSPPLEKQENQLIEDNVLLRPASPKKLEEHREKRGFQVVKRRKNKLEEERDSDISELSREISAMSRDISEIPPVPGSGGNNNLTGLPKPSLGGPQFPLPGGVPPPPSSGHPLSPTLPLHLHPLQASQLYPQLMNNRYYQQYQPYYQLYYQQYQQLQLQHQQQLYQALGRVSSLDSNNLLNKSQSLSKNIHHLNGGKLVPGHISRKIETLSSPNKLHLNRHFLRDFPENYESFRSGLSPDRRSSSSSDSDSVISGEKPVRNLTASFDSVDSMPKSDHKNRTEHRNMTNGSHGNHNIHNNHLHNNTNNTQRLIEHCDNVNKQSVRKTVPELGSRAKKVGNVCPPVNVNAESRSTGGGGDGKQIADKNGKLWPAWVYCTRYSDRPSSGPRSRKVRRNKTGKVEKQVSPEQCKPINLDDDKRPRTAFSAEQLAKLKKEFDENRYLTEQRRQQLASELGLNESQIKIWFQNKRAKVKKSSGQKNKLAMELMAQGLYNHATVAVE